MADRAQDTEAIRAALRRSEGFTASSASEAFLALDRLVARLEADERVVLAAEHHVQVCSGETGGSWDTLGTLADALAAAVPGRYQGGTDGEGSAAAAPGETTEPE